MSPSACDRPQEVVRLEDQLRRLQSRLEEEARDDDPILQEIERITSWLELFNSLFKGLVKMNRILEKSSACHEKLNLLVNQRTRNGTSARRVERNCERVQNSNPLPSARQPSISFQEQCPSPSLSFSKNALNPALTPLSDDLRAKRDSLAARVSAVLRRTAFPDECHSSGSSDQQETALVQGTGARSSSSCSSSSHKSSSSMKSSDASVRTMSKSASRVVSVSTAASDNRLQGAHVAAKWTPLPGSESAHSGSSRNERIAQSTVTRPLKNCRRIGKQIPSEFPSLAKNIPLSQSGPNNSHRMHNQQHDADVLSGRKPKSWFIGMNGQAMSVSLQEAFEQLCGDFKQRSTRRSEVIRRRGEVRRIAHAALTEARDGQQGWAYRLMQRQEESSNIRRPVLPCQPFKEKRIFTHKEMRSQTERIYRNLPEVREREREVRKEMLKHTHDIMKHVFTNKVQQQSLRGRVHFPITQNFICY